ncbi:MAG: VanZ family protein [Agathobacter sp.]|nr:VanZ family protein [Agathobacter sp.]
MAANKRKGNYFMWVCFLAYLLLVGYVLFYSPWFGREDHIEYRYNLTLFQEIGRYYRVGLRTGSWNLFLWNVVGNICVFMPLGIFVPKLFKRCRNVLFVTILSLELSILAEVIQLLTRVGSFDVDDLLLNTLGGILGYLIYKIVSKAKEDTR